MTMLGMEYNRNVWKINDERIKEHGRRRWRSGFGIKDREQEYPCGTALLVNSHHVL